MSQGRRRISIAIRLRRGFGKQAQVWLVGRPGHIMAWSLLLRTEGTVPCLPEPVTQDGTTRLQLQEPSPSPYQPGFSEAPAGRCLRGVASEQTGGSPVALTSPRERDHKQPAGQLNHLQPVGREGRDSGVSGRTGRCQEGWWTLWEDGSRQGEQVWAWGTRRGLQRGAIDPSWSAGTLWGLCPWRSRMEAEQERPRKPHPQQTVRNPAVPPARHLSLSVCPPPSHVRPAPRIRPCISECSEHRGRWQPCEPTVPSQSRPPLSHSTQTPSQGCAKGPK